MVINVFVRQDPPPDAQVIEPNAGWVAATLVPGSANRPINPQSRSTSFSPMATRRHGLQTPNQVGAIPRVVDGLHFQSRTNRSAIRPSVASSSKKSPVFWLVNTATINGPPG